MSVSVTEANLRQVLGDNPTGGGTDILSTNQYVVVTTAYPNDFFKALSMAAGMIATTFAEKVKTAAGPVKIELQQKFEHYMFLKKSYWLDSERGTGNLTPIITGVSVDGMDDVRDDTDRVEPAFKRDQFNIPETDNIYDKEDYY
jgi:hypothetical protein